MNRHLVSISVLLLAGLAQSAALAAPQPDKAAGVVADARKAIGAKSIDRLSSLSVEASVTRDVGAMQLTSNVELLVQLPDKYARTETVSNGPATSTSTIGFNGDTAIQRFSAPPQGGGVVIRMGGPGMAAFGSGTAETPTSEQKAAMNAAAVRTATFELSRLMLGWFATAHPRLNATYTYAAEAESPDGKAFVIDVKGGDDFTARLFVDERTHLPLMLTYRAPKPRIITRRRGSGDAPAKASAAGGRAAIPPDAAGQAPEMADYTIYFDDWRGVDGVTFPYKMSRAVDGTTSEVWTVTKVNLNPSIDASKFAVEGS
ncbi:MAG TPA: hypothetical protein VGL62_00335 [Vicinamibacterales bacterium]